MIAINAGEEYTVTITIHNYIHTFHCDYITPGVTQPTKQMATNLHNMTRVKFQFQDSFRIKTILCYRLSALFCVSTRHAIQLSTLKMSRTLRILERSHTSGAAYRTLWSSG
jgi:hypothetical protein